ncbi:CBS domain-containing protein [Symbiobacterium terraclitae]|jgi:CBS domain-containing protein|uniref:CBS domain-containing protein n=1 Tax=Symbiobacterium terraclitae TaxID=557451 RepID=A0ABS4JSI6_9FIRM|nr:CBS domain-containing protein [Symbiobacterium terraclitae]MBP2018491.1 CBS domain-containing protein [Symbiobacterium terraclitae]
MRLRQLMTTNVRTCQPDTPLVEVARIMDEVNCGFVPVVEGGRPVGTITDRDIVVRAVAMAKDIRTVKARECMSSPVITATPDTDAHEAADIMAEKQIRRLCVVEGGRLVGVVALGDLATERIHTDEAGEALSAISEPSQPDAH